MRALSYRWRMDRRRPWVFWAIATVGAVTTAAVAAGMVNEVERRMEAWGPSRVVAIARRPLEPGAVVGPSDIEGEARPAGALPDGAIDGTNVLEGRVVVDRILAGEPVVAERLAPNGVRGVAALVPPGSAAVLVPASARPPRLAVGNRVELFGGLAPGSANGGAGADVVARDATVIEVSDDGSLLVAVPREQAAAAAAAILDGAVVVALIGS